jgi:hypothetical protein
MEAAGGCRLDDDLRRHRSTANGGHVKQQRSIASCEFIASVGKSHKEISFEPAGPIDPCLKGSGISSRDGRKQKGRSQPPLQVLDREPEKAGVPHAPPLS